MKDITDYFNRSSSEKTTANEKLTSTPEEQSKSTKSKRRKKDKTKKVKGDASKTPQDSPSKRSNSKQALKNNDEETSIENCQGKEFIAEVQETASNSIILSPKVNAFQFLMKSRNKVIGTNSPGKELDSEEESPTVVSREKLAARKSLLQNWSDSKKARKRKLEDDEIDNCIKVKLDVRKKRFKTLLKVDDSKTTDLDSEKPTSAEEIVYGKKENGGVGDHKAENVKSIGKKMKRSVKMNMSSDDFESVEGTKKSESGNKKHKRKHKKKSKESDLKNVNKGAKTWKMRIKLNDNLENNPALNTEHMDDVIEGPQQYENFSKDLKIEENMVLDQESNDNQDERVIILDQEPDTSVSINEVLNGKEDCGGFTGKEVNGENSEFKRVLRSRRPGLPKDNIVDVILSSESSDDSFEVKSVNKKKLKVAPVFAKAIPKPKIDPKVLEAKRNFLLSEMPDTLKRKIEKLESSEVPEFDLFPKISHVHQIEQGESFWDLPHTQLLLKTSENFTYDHSNLVCESIIDSSLVKQSLYENSEPIKDVKTIIKNLKTENAHYPVYKIYRILKEKTIPETGNSTENEPKQRRSKSKGSSRSMEPTNSDNVNSISSFTEHAMWTDKYKPRKFEDLIGNVQAVSALKKWLDRWQEIFNNRKKSRYNSSDSESDFISSDSGSVNYSSSLNTMLVLTGPCGSGKSSSVYAICEEMGLEVIELNASSRRTGKQILQELQEATQSHQVHNNKGDLLAFTTSEKQPKKKNNKKDSKKLKKCVLLIEDIDIVFDQDEGFIAAILQISSTTKRPIILTTTDPRSQISKKFLEEFKTIKFHALSSKTFGMYLQILCLLEGYFVDISSISELFEYNRGDIRKSILELQFWIQSGGQISKHKNLIKSPYNFENHILDTEDFVETDEPNIFGSLKELSANLEDYRTHVNIIADFENFQVEKFYNVPLNSDLAKIWWNIPVFITLDSTIGEKKRKLKKKLGILSEMYDSLALCDVSLNKNLFKCDKPVCERRCTKLLSNSLELGEVYTGYSSNYDLIFEWSYYLVDRRLNICRESKERLMHPTTRNQRLFNMGLPEIRHMSKLSRSHQNETELLQAIPQFCHFDRKSTAMDYLPTLRNIARSEKVRSQFNVKRHNRFHHYLQNFSIKCSDSVLTHAYDALSIKIPEKLN